MENSPADKRNQSLKSKSALRTAGAQMMNQGSIAALASDIKSNNRSPTPNVSPLVKDLQIK